MDKLDKPLDSIIKENKKGGSKGGRGGKGGVSAGVNKRIGVAGGRRNGAAGGFPAAGGNGGGGGGRGPARVGGGGIKKTQKLNQGAISKVGAILNTPGRDHGRAPKSFQKQAPSGNSDGDWSHDKFENKGNQQGGGRRQGGGAGAGGARKHFTTGGARVRESESRQGGQRNFTTGGNRGGKMQITNLHFELNEKQLESIFSKEGSLKKVTIHFDRSGRSLGTADVVFESKEDAVACARKYNNAKIEGQFFTQATK